MISINNPAKDPNQRVLSTGATERYVFRSRIENPPSFLFLYSLLEYIMVRDVYVVKGHLYLCAESLIQIEMRNDSVDKI